MESRLHLWTKLWMFTKLARIYDSDGGCCHRVNWCWAFKAVDHSPIQTTGYRADYHPGYQRQAIITRESWGSESGVVDRYLSKCTTRTNGCEDSYSGKGHSLRYHYSELPSMKHSCIVARQLQLISSLANCCHWWRRDLNHSCGSTKNNHELSIKWHHTTSWSWSWW